MSQHPRKKLPHGNSRKGKHAEVDKPTLPKATESTPPSNLLLAGYLAYEFLTKGTLLGRKFEIDSAQVNLVGSTSAKPKRSQLNSQAIASTAEPRPSERKEHDSYEVVASILKTDGAYIKGIVNPTQLSNWINK
ncbi:hypothetical protein E2542_SST23417 [Spatholobus suberectus]|nr:hypothetical protein E2542_SST23417 [Spatholobus suberectus]